MSKSLKILVFVQILFYVWWLQDSTVSADDEVTQKTFPLAKNFAQIEAQVQLRLRLPRKFETERVQNNFKTTLVRN